MRAGWRLAMVVTATGVILAGREQRANAADVPGSVGELIASASGLAPLIQDAIADLGVQGQVVIGSAQSALNGAISDLRSLVNSDLSRQVSSLTGAAAAVAMQLHNTVGDLDRILRVRTQCAFEGLDRFLYGVKTIVAQLQNAIPLAKAAKPFVYAFTFDGHSAGVVPAEGGRISVRGQSMWHDGLEPAVSIVDDHRHAIGSLTATHANDTDSISVFLDPGIIQSNRGRCLAFEIVPREKRWYGGTRNLDPMYLPLCVPETVSAQYQFVSNAIYTCPGTSGETRLETAIFDCTNDSCEHGGACHAEHSWSLPVNCRIVRFDSQDGGNKFNNNTVTERISGGSTITADGSLDSATCVCVPIAGCKRTHHTEYQKLITPYATCSTNSYPPGAGSSALRPISGDVTPTCVSVTRPCDETSSSFRVELSVALGGDTPKRVVSLPAVTVTSQTSPLQTIDYLGLHVQGTVNPRVGNNSEICLAVSSPRCGY